MNTQRPPRLLITRPQAQGEAFARRLDAQQPGAWEVCVAPIIEIAFLEVEMPDQGAAIFTSANGVTAWIRNSDRRGPAFCVGAATTAKARGAGFEAKTAGKTGARLAAQLSKAPPTDLVHLRGAHTTGRVAETLRAAGHRVTEVIGYQQTAAPLPNPILRDLAEGRIAAVTLFSPRSARMFAAAVAPLGLAPSCAILCLSANVAKAIPAPPTQPIRIAASPDAGAMLGLISSAREFVRT